MWKDTEYQWVSIGGAGTWRDIYGGPVWVCWALEGCLEWFKGGGCWDLGVVFRGTDHGSLCVGDTGP